MVGISEALSRYPIDVENMEEMDRLTKQAQMVTRYAGLYPPQMQMKEEQIILDIGCGPGEWVLEMARTNPSSRIVGIDISKRMVAYANSCARVHRLTNACFEEGDVCAAFPFPDSAFDMVNARFIVSFQSEETWPFFLSECYRVLRPGGMMCSTEVDNLGITNSSALARYDALLTAYSRKGRHCFTEAGIHNGILAMQEYLLRRRGFAAIQQHAQVMNYSVDTAAFPLMAENLASVMHLMQPALLREELIDLEQLTLLHTQVLAEIHRDNFCAIEIFQTVWGHKPV